MVPSRVNQYETDTTALVIIWSICEVRVRSLTHILGGTPLLKGAKYWKDVYKDRSHNWQTSHELLLPE